jgi:L-fucose mutarotase
MEDGRLKGIPKILSPDLLHALMSMGHSDKIVLADDNFPSASISKAGPILIRADGHGIPNLLTAIMKFFPLDEHVYSPVMLMDLVNKDKNNGMKDPAVWETYQEILDESDGKKVNVSKIERFKFYDLAKEAYAVVATGEKTPYGNIILQKGVIA